VNAAGQPPHDRPSAPELLEAVEELLRGEVMGAVEGRLRFLVRVAANALAIVARQLALGPVQEQAHARRLARLGVHDDAELAAAIRSGSLDDRYHEVLEVVRQAVADKLAVANPGYGTGGAVAGESGDPGHTGRGHPPGR
jgi:hypothetical protein